MLAFILINFWQLRLSLRFRNFLRHHESLQSLMTDSSSRDTSQNNDSFVIKSKMLNEPPLVFQNNNRLTQPPPPPPSNITLKDESSLNQRRTSMYSHMI